MYTLIGTAKLNDIDQRAWLADVLARIADTPKHRLGELLPWNWRQLIALLKAVERPSPEAYFASRVKS